MRIRECINNGLLAALCVVFLVVVLSACGGSGGGSGGGGGADNAGQTRPPASAPPTPNEPDCDEISQLVDGACVPFARRLDRLAQVPFADEAGPVALEVVLYTPLAEGRFPLLVFHHGSTGNGSDPRLFAETFVSPAVIEFFVTRGWMVAFPQRRGRGRSGGTYDEGFNSAGTAYSCRLAPATAGAARALADADAALDWLLLQPEVDPSQVVAAGSSRGGILALMHLARRGETLRGAVNFVGGWTGEGCGDYRQINRALFRDAAAFPGASLWLYARGDSFYSLEHSRANFEAFMSAGGLGNFQVFERDSGLNGHFLVNSPELWGSAVDAYLDNLR